MSKHSDGDSGIIRFQCSQCGKSLKVPASRAGQKGKCTCGARLAIPPMPHDVDDELQPLLDVVEPIDPLGTEAGVASAVDLGTLDPLGEAVDPLGPTMPTLATAPKSPRQTPTRTFDEEDEEREQSLVQHIASVGFLGGIFAIGMGLLSIVTGIVMAFSGGAVAVMARLIALCVGLGFVMVIGGVGAIVRSIVDRGWAGEGDKFDKERKRNRIFNVLIWTAGALIIGGAVAVVAWGSYLAHRRANPQSRAGAIKTFVWESHFTQVSRLGTRHC